MAIKFDRKPYTVSYMKDGVQHKIRRRPPKKLHNIFPKDEVVLTRKKNDDFNTDDEFKVKGINKRQPNVLKLENDEGKTTFVDYYDLKLERKLGERKEGQNPLDLPENTDYLVWP